MNEVACVCPRCGTPFTFAVTEGDDRPQPETQEDERVKVPPIPQEPERRQESQAASGGRQAQQTPPPFTKPNPMPTSPYSPNYKRKNNGCLRNCLLVFIVSFIVLVFTVRNCHVDRSYTQDALRHSNVENNDLNVADGMEQVESRYEKPPHWLDGTWRVETEHGPVVITIYGNRIVELFDGEENRGSFVYKRGMLYCDFGDGDTVVREINKKKRSLLYDGLPMEKQ